MAQFAPVAPIQILEQMQQEGCFGTYHLLLAHHVLEFPDRFRELFSHGQQCTIIMDNSIVELGDAENEEKVLEACKVLQSEPFSPNYIVPVLTDVMGDGASTREKAHASWEWWKEHAPEYNTMVVLQGENWEDFCKTADQFCLDPQYQDYISYVGIPRVLVGSVGSRHLAVEYVDAIRPDISVHLLGFSDDVTDDVITSQHAAVEGIDSAVPVRFSYSRPRERYTPTAEIPPRPKDWFEKGEYDDSVWTNVEAMRRWVA